MKKIVLMAAALFAFAAVSFVSCSGDDNAVSYVPKAGQKTLYRASSSYSDYMNKTLSVLGCQAYYGASSGDAPDIFVVKGSDAASLDEDKVALAIKTCVDGKTLVIDSPTSSEVVALGARMRSVLNLEEYASLKARAKMNEDAPDYAVHRLVSALSDNEAEKASLQEGQNVLPDKHEAIALRGSHIYYVHDIADALEDNSVEFFSDWMAGTEAAVSASRAIDPKALESLISKAVSPSDIDALAQGSVQTFTHLCSMYDQYGIGENMELTNDVWAVCNINEQKDYYLVRNSAACHNNDVLKRADAYFQAYDINTCFNNQRDGTLRTGDCSPQTTQGSQTFTSGTSMGTTDGVTAGVQASLGFNMSGPTGGVTWTTTTTHSTTFTVSSSSTRSIPDIKIEFGVWKPYTEDIPCWTFSTPHEGSGGWPLAIQTTTAVFDTYSVFVFPSDKGNDDGTIDLHEQIRLHFASRDNSNYYDSPTDLKFVDDHVKKPSNVCKAYVMGFSPPAGVSPTDIRSLTASLIEKCKEPDRQLWYDSAVYYTWARGTDEQKAEALNSVAKSQFALAKDKITNNKSVFKDAGFRGQYTFYIQIDDNNRIDEFTIDFGS